MVAIDFSKTPEGIVPAIVQEAGTGQVLMLAYINEEAWERTLATGKAHYWSRSRRKLWLKGESSGNVQIIKDILVDCDLDCVVYVVEQLGGAACHEGYPSCFYRRVNNGGLEIIQSRVFDPETVYGGQR